MEDKRGAYEHYGNSYLFIIHIKKGKGKRLWRNSTILAYPKQKGLFLNSIGSKQHKLMNTINTCPVSS